MISFLYIYSERQQLKPSIIIRQKSQKHLNTAKGVLGNACTCVKTYTNYNTVVIELIKIVNYSIINLRMNQNQNSNLIL